MYDGSTVRARIIPFRKQDAKVAVALCLCITLWACGSKQESADDVLVKKELVRVWKADGEADAEALQRIIDMGSSAIAPLGRALENGDPDARAAAAAALGGIGGRQVIPGLVRAISDNSAKVRHEAALALAWMGQDEPDRRILTALKAASSDSCRGVRLYVAIGFGWFGDESCRPFLKRMLWDSDGMVRVAAKFALKALNRRK